MKIIFTKEDKKTVRKNVEGFRQSYVIDAREIILELDYVEGQLISSPHDFIINKEIEKKMAQAIINKKSQQIIYFHYTINNILVKNVKAFFRANGIKPTYCIFDPSKSNKNIYHLFDEVLS